MLLSHSFPDPVPSAFLSCPIAIIFSPLLLLPLPGFQFFHPLLSSVLILIPRLFTPGSPTEELLGLLHQATFPALPTHQPPGGDPTPLPLLHELPEKLLLYPQIRSGWRSPVPLHPPNSSSGLASLPSWPECCRCSCKSHPNTRSFELPFFFPFCRDFMAGAPGPWPSHLGPPRPLPYQSPMGSQASLWAWPGPRGAGLRTGGGEWPGQRAAAPASGAPATRK